MIRIVSDLDNRFWPAVVVDLALTMWALGFGGPKLKLQGYAAADVHGDFQRGHELEFCRGHHGLWPCAFGRVYIGLYGLGGRSGSVDSRNFGNSGTGV